LCGAQTEQKTVRETWTTKFGQRRVRQEPPSIAEALEAAADISGDSEQQIEIAAGLLGVDAAAVRSVAAKIVRTRQPVVRAPAVAARRSEPRRVVVVEQKRRRFVVAG
jgi:hypothetical protein